MPPPPSTSLNGSAGGTQPPPAEPPHVGGNVSPVHFLRLPDEPERWYDRFETYRLLGPTRTLEATYRIHTPHGTRPGHQWRSIAHRFHWHARAAAWDLHHHQSLRDQEEERRFAAREARLTMIEDLLRQTYTVLRDIPPPDAESMTTTLATYRTLFRDLITAQRIEYELYQPTPHATGQFTLAIEDLRAAHDELRQWAETQ